MLWLMLISTNDNSAKVSAQTTRENPKPLVKNSTRLFEIIRGEVRCALSVLTCTQLKSTNQILPEALLVVVRVCAQEKKHKNFLPLFLLIKKKISPPLFCSPPHY